MNEGRVPPYNQEAECAVLGSILLNNESWGKVHTLLSGDDFYIYKNKVIFESIGSLMEAGTPIDHVTLGGELMRRGDLERIGGAMALDDLTRQVATVANVNHYAHIVREAAAIRKVIQGAQKVVSEGFGANGVDGLSAGMDELIMAARGLARTRMPDSLLAMGDRVMDNYELVASGFRGIELPWPSMDMMTAGLWPKTLTMFVARPGTGKTFVAVVCARHAWLKGRKVLIVSPEMSKDEIAERFFVIQAGVSYHNVITGQLPTTQKMKLAQTIEEAKKLDGLWIMDSDDDLTPKGIEAAIRACEPDLVACDSIYDIKIKGDRKERALGALEFMKRNCKELNYASVGFAQQNRSAELAENKGGGARLGTIALADEIGQDAHAVFALEQSKDERDDKRMNFKPLKLRRGQSKKSKVVANWDFDRMFFDEIIEEKKADEDEDMDEIPF